MEAIRILKESPKGPPQEVDEERCLDIIKRYSAEYRRQVIALAPLVNELARYVPSRRKRKLHIGLFGYSREMSQIRLPRAITFTAALYSIGLPPELLALNVLTREDMGFLRGVYLNLEEDLRDALAFSNPNAAAVLPKGMVDVMQNPFGDFPVNREHKELTDAIINMMLRDDREHIMEYVVKAASISRFLG